MKKKYIIGLMSLLAITGCTSVPSLKYDGDDIIHLCSEEDISLFDEKLIVEIDDEQSFVIIDDDNKLTEYKEGNLKFNKKDDLNVKRCLFVSYDEIENNKFGTSNPIKIGNNLMDMIEVKMFGKYSYKIKDIEKYLDYYDNDEVVSTAVRENFISYYSKYFSGKSFDEMLVKIKFDYSEL